jgi:transcription factor E2F3
MSDSIPTEILRKKRTRGKQHKLMSNKSKPKLIQKKLKIGKKTKIRTGHIDIIKPKPIKKCITYQAYHPSLINQNSTFEKTYQEEENDFKKEDSCQENSLGQLTKNFINYIKTTGKKSININDLVNELEVKKRRIYDITNVLQGIGYLQKSGKNEIIWTKTVMNKTKSKKKLSTQKKNNNNINRQKTNKEQLEQEKEKYEIDINKFKKEFNYIAKNNEFPRYGYITTDDLKSLSINDKVDFLIIKATKGTVMNIVDKKEIKLAYEKVKNLMENKKMKANDVLLNILKKSNQLIFNCPEEVGLNFYNVNKGEIQEIGTNTNSNKNSGNNISVSKYVNNNINIKNVFENNNYNVAFNYNVNINKDNMIPNNSNSNINNFFSSNNNQEEIGKSKKPSNNNNIFLKTNSFFVNYNERGNNDTIPNNNITIKNEQKNIGVYAIQTKGSFSQPYKYNAQISAGGENNYKSKVENFNNNNNKNVNTNFIEENFSFTANSNLK